MVELLYWEGCPSYERAVDDLRAALERLGSRDPIEVRQIDTEEQAKQQRFVGSPTIRVDGRDLFPIEDEPYGLTCRIYRRRGGGVSPLPDPQDLRRALAQALQCR